MANPISSSPADTFRDDFSCSSLNIPLKDAPIVSLRALENGEEDYEDVDLSKRGTVWRRLLMTIRRRRNGREPLPEHELLRRRDDKSRFARAKPLKRKWIIRLCVAAPVLVLCFFGVVHLANVFMSLVPVLWDDSDSFLPNWGAPGELGEGLSSYPTDFTRDVVPIQCHSHNDYWRRVPLYEALHYGCTGVEADVWLFENELYVGHNTISLTKNRTFRSLYVDPLVQILDQQNSVNEFEPADTNIKNGVFDTNPAQTLVLLVDFKNYGPDIYPVVRDQLSTLREKGYLSHFDGETVVHGPITVVATGNAPFDLIIANTTYRDIFFDAPLDRMYEQPTTAQYHHDPNLQPLSPGPQRRRSGQGTVGTTPDSVFDEANSYYASVSFKKSVGRIWGSRLSAKQIDLVRGQIQGAHSRGLKVRYWNTPKWPIGLRNHVWDVLVKEGVDYLNGDDLRGMTKVDWTVRKHHGWL